MIREMMRKAARNILPKIELRRLKLNSPIEEPKRVMIASKRLA